MMFLWLVKRGDLLQMVSGLKIIPKSKKGKSQAPASKCDQQLVLRLQAKFERLFCLLICNMRFTFHIIHDRKPTQHLDQLSRVSDLTAQLERPD